VSRLCRHPDLLGGAVAAALSVVGAVVAMQLWNADSAIPLIYIGDSQFFLATVKGTLEHGWYLENASLGFPLGSEWQDFPVASDDTVHLLIVHLLGLFTDNAVTVLHLFYVLGYALTAITAFVALRWLEISRWVAVVCAVLFSLLPYHFFVGEAHPFHSSYWVVPLASLLVLAVLLDRPLFERRPEAHGPLGWASGTTLLTLGACVLIGSAGSIYYSLFAVALVVLAGLLAAIRRHWRRPLATAGVIAGVLLAVVVLNLAPTILYDVANGENNSVAERTPDESERYSLSLFGLLAPAEGHRIGPFDDLRDDYVETSPFENAAVPGLGVVGALGFIWLMVFALASALRPGRWVARSELHGAASAAGLTAFLIATTGGFSLLFAHLVSPQLRVWVRLEVFIAFFALVAVGALLDWALRSRTVARHGRVVAGAILSAVLLLGFFDQTNYVPAYDQTRAEWESDAAIVSAIEDELGPDAAVFQLPYVPFPEWYPSGGTVTFDPLRPYLHSSDLRWSYGSMFGRSEDWHPGLVDERIDSALARISAVGFDGVLVDRYAYPDNATELETAIGEVASAEPIVSPNGRFSFFDLRPYSEEAVRTVSPDELETLRANTLSPLVAQAGPGLIPTRTELGNYSPDFEMAGKAAQLGLVNPSGEPRDAALRMALAPDAPASVEVRLPRGESVRVTPNAPRVARVLLPPGTTIVQLSSTAESGPGLLRIGLSDAQQPEVRATTAGGGMTLQAGAETAPAGTVAPANVGAGP
jgi:phosphoglycerol transferase